MSDRDIEVAKAQASQAPVRSMTCCCCGEYAGRFHQWFNRDRGYGICRPCKLEHNESGYPDSSVGYEGINWASAEQWAAIVEKSNTTR